MKLSAIAKKNKICILGFGVEGRATLKFLKYFFPNKEYIIADEKDGEDYLEKQKDCDLVIKSPGINKKFAKKPYTTATNIFFANNNDFTIGITGTKGKSTTASLIYSIIKNSGKEVCLVGNIGFSMLETLLGECKKRKIKTVGDLENYLKHKKEAENIIYVCELSSYQLDDIKYSPNISVITNLYSDHMDYHGGIEKYRTAKKNIVNYAKGDDLFVYNQDFEELKDLANSLEIKTKGFAPKAFLEKIKNELPLVGLHNIDNMRAAVTVAKHLKIQDTVILNALKKFQPLEHRMEFVGKYRNILFYDDAISTTPESTIAAIEALEKVNTIFLGGLDRGYDFSELAKKIIKSNIKNIVFFPDSGEKILDVLEKKRLGKKFNILKTEKMKEAVEFAFQNTKEGCICLLSTASPSYSLWKNFEKKGDEFKKYAKKIGEK